MVVRESRNPPHDRAVVIRLTHKFADMLDGVDLRTRRVGDTFALGARDALLLIAEGWAEAVAERRVERPPSVRAAAADPRRQRRGPRR